VLRLEAPALGWLVVGALACALALAAQSCWVTAHTTWHAAQVMRSRDSMEYLMRCGRPVRDTAGAILWIAPPVPPAQTALQDTVRRRGPPC